MVADVHAAESFIHKQKISKRKKYSTFNLFKSRQICILICRTQQYNFHKQQKIVKNRLETQK